MDKQKSSFKKCPNSIGAFSGITIDGKKIVAGTLPCNSWHCPSCQKRLKKKLYRRILQGAIGDDLTSPYAFKFLTLTFGGKEARAQASTQLKEHNENLILERKEPLTLKEYIYDIMVHNFHKLIRALKKKYGNFHYFRVAELHKDGIPHFHILFAGNAIIPKGILASIENLWRSKYGMGFVRINCVKFRDKKHAIRYMLKYITKDIQKIGKWKRIFSASRGSLVKIFKNDWLAVNVHVGHVTDKGIEEMILDEVRIRESIIPDLSPLSKYAIDAMRQMYTRMIASI
ncbi:rolling circle replication-associated protein [Desulfobacula toluolica]|uniref:Conserved uncharacterized protein n=1 Tax=Desulfobacula toluolica (strain DSM 7467 / Tol2) TaxID=651182 RepID=K0NJX8_DESTT|nr:hypothetical protein [Desulfobacula toluolica]CCK81150.1 conserved uncharacterized protein [Desulfobacula toluolica Tol2]